MVSTINLPSWRGVGGRAGARGVFEIGTVRVRDEQGRKGAKFSHVSHQTTLQYPRRRSRPSTTTPNTPAAPRGVDAASGGREVPDFCLRSLIPSPSDVPSSWCFGATRARLEGVSLRIQACVGKLRGVCSFVCVPPIEALGPHLLKSYNNHHNGYVFVRGREPTRP